MCLWPRVTGKEAAPCPTSASTANTASAWPRRARSPGNGPRGGEEVRHGLHRVEGETATRWNSRAAASAAAHRRADHFDLHAKLGFLLGAFSKTIEGEILKNLDTLLAQAQPAKTAKAAAPARKAAAKRPTARK
jgi:hypothetical protein